MADKRLAVLTLGGTPVEVTVVHVPSETPPHKVRKPKTKKQRKHSTDVK